MAALDSDKAITDFFIEHSTEALCDFFQSATNKRETFGVKIISLCCNEIVKGYQCHIINAAMKKCLKGYKRWSVHVTGGNQSITIKMNDNLIILSHQVQQWDKYTQCDDSDPWKRKIKSIIHDTEFRNDFKSLFFGMNFM